ncbi:MAG TPA: hypothetical protein VF681_09600 [Abditibacteriaceae bacterium]|jgi:hypothetical protein
MSRLSNDSAWAIAQRLPAVSSSERDQILQWARETPLTYGAWKPFKKLFKILDEAARVGQPFDTELLGVFLARIDRHVPAGAMAQLVPNSEAPEIVGSSKQFHNTTHSFHVGARHPHDSSGWRVTATPLEGPPHSLLQSVGRKLGLSGAAASSAQRRTWDFNARGYSPLKSVELKNDVLSVSTYYGDAHKIDVSDPDFLHFVGSGPSRETWAYLKRRARRLLRTLQTRDEYWPLLLAMLHAGGPEPLDTAWQWATTDALFGGGPRLKQSGHGRGTVEIDRTFWNRRREERAPAVWDAHQAEVRTLAADVSVPLEASAVAINVLRASGDSPEILAEIPPRQLERFLGCEMAWLQVLAAREALRRWLSGVLPSGAIAAQLAVLAGTRTRQAARELLASLPFSDGSWQSSFATPLLALLDRAPSNAAQSRRAREAAFLLATLARDSISDEAFWRHLTQWLAVESAAGADFSLWIEARLTAAGKAGQTQHFAALDTLEGDARERAIQAFLREAGKHAPGKDAAVALVTQHETSLNALGWRYLAATAIEPKVIHALWKQLFENYYNPSIYFAAFGDEAAPLLHRTPLTPKEIAGLWAEDNAPLYRQSWYRIVNYASAGFFRAWISVSAPDEIARRVFKTLALLPLETQSGIIEEFLPFARDFAPDEAQVRGALMPAGFYSAARDSSTALRFLAASLVSIETLRALWKEIFSLAFSAEAAPAAIELLRRAELSSDEIGAWLREHFGRIEQFPPDFLAALLRRSPAALLDGMLRAGEAQLPALRVLLHEQLRDAAFLSSFWNALWPLLRDEAQRESIEQNLLSDSTITRSFAQLEDVGEFFATDEPAHEPLLLLWLDAYLAQLQRDDTTLLLAATCPLSEVHRRALEQVRAVGLNLPLTLRLLESKLPPAMKLARDWFEESSPENEAERALALADSPDFDVQQIGREFILARRARLLTGETLQRLAENTSAPMQEWVAAQLQQTGEAVSTDEFDRTVLRARGRNRKAKELVKTRLDASAEVAPATLLELARGRNTRDREWALQQLAKQALAGQQIDGVELAE